MNWNLNITQKGLLDVAIILIVAFISYRIVVFATRQLKRLASLEPDEALRSTREQRAETLRDILNNIARVVFLVFVVMMLLSEVGLDIRPIIAGAGIVGIAVGFGAQSLVRDYLAGFFIVFEHQFGIGDQVTIAGHSGTVERMSLRATTLRDADGGVHVVPNGKIETVLVQSHGWVRASVDVTVAYTERIERVLGAIERVCGEVGREHAKDLFETPTVAGIEQFTNEGPTIRVEARTRVGRQSVVARELRQAIKLAFEDEGIAFRNAAAARVPAVESTES